MLNWRRRQPAEHVIDVQAMGQFRVVTGIRAGDGTTTPAMQRVQVFNDWHGPSKTKVLSKTVPPHQFRALTTGELLDSDRSWRLVAELQGDMSGIRQSAELNPETATHGTVRVTVHVETRSRARRKYDPDPITISW